MKRTLPLTENTDDVTTFSARVVSIILSQRSPRAKYEEITLASKDNIVFDAFSPIQELVSENANMSLTQLDRLLVDHAHVLWNHNRIERGFSDRRFYEVVLPVSDRGTVVYGNAWAGEESKSFLHHTQKELLMPLSEMHALSVWHIEHALHLHDTLDLESDRKTQLDTLRAYWLHWSKTINSELWKSHVFKGLPIMKTVHTENIFRAFKGTNPIASALPLNSSWTLYHGLKPGSSIGDMISDNRGDVSFLTAPKKRHMHTGLLSATWGVNAALSFAEPIIHEMRAVLVLHYTANSLTVPIMGISPSYLSAMTGGKFGVDEEQEVTLEPHLNWEVDHVTIHEDILGMSIMRISEIHRFCPKVAFIHVRIMGSGLMQ